MFFAQGSIEGIIKALSTVVTKPKLPEIPQYKPTKENSEIAKKAARGRRAIMEAEGYE